MHASLLPKRSVRSIRSHAGQVRASVRKRLNQKRKSRELRAEADRLGISVGELERRRAAEALVANLAFERERALRAKKEQAQRPRAWF